MGHDNGQDLELHKAVFHNEHWRLQQLMNDTNIFVKDVHGNCLLELLFLSPDRNASSPFNRTTGNTPLHLAVMLGHRECIDQLVARNAPVNMKNVQGWSPLAEAISYGDRPTGQSSLSLSLSFPAT
jgi:ankyrin repeat protein